MLMSFLYIYYDIGIINGDIMSSSITTLDVINILLGKDDSKLLEMVFDRKIVEYPMIWHKIVLPDLSKRKSISDDVLVTIVEELMYGKNIACDESGATVLYLELITNKRYNTISYCIEHGLYVNVIYEHLTKNPDTPRKNILDKLSENAITIMGIMRV